MEVKRYNVPVIGTEFQIQNKAAITRTKRKGTVVRELAVATYDVSGGDDGAVGAHGLGIYLPTKAIVTKAWVDIVTTFADGASDSATIALSIESAGDLVAAIAISNGANPWDAGLHDTKVNNFALDGNALTQLAMASARAATMIKTTAARQITATVAAAALTAGKMNVFVEYVISD